MTGSTPKQEIVQSLSNLDAAQSEKVLDFIRALVRQKKVYTPDELRRRAMIEINQALGRGPLWI